MATLLLRLAGPMQSWGTRSRFDDRDTERMPSKSGIVGLLCAALGRPRSASVEDLAALKLGARADRPGVLATDYHTALDVARASGSGAGTVVSRRHYLADAVFLVGLEGEEPLLERLQWALQRPVWPLFLGRKAFPPSAPLFLPDGLRAGALRTELPVYPWLGARSTHGEPSPERLQVEWECGPDEEGEPRQDVPGSFAERRYGIRRVRHEWVTCPSALEERDASQQAGR
jgi:CRISPR system Cascade subunit CasD